MSAFKCKMCGGTLEINKDYATATCEYCGRQTVLTDEMKAYAAKVKAENERAESETTRRDEKKRYEANERLQHFRKRKLSKVILVFMFLCLFGGMNYCSNGMILTGIISIAQAILLAVAWLMGMQFIKEKKANLHVVVATIAFLLFILIPVSMTTRVNAPFISKKASPSIATVTETNAEEGIFVYPVRNYVGKNLAACGRLSGERLEDEYGSGDVKLAVVTMDGAYVDVTNAKKIKNYVVIGQSIEPNSDLIVVHLRDSTGEPYSNLVDYQSHEEIILYVCDVDDADENVFEQGIVTMINGSPDRHTYFIRDYSGRNAASFGREWGEGRIDEYGEGELRLTFTADDGTYINPADISQLREYVVTGQDLAPNTELTLVYQTNSRGEEYDNLIQSQNYEEINLYVTRCK